RIETIIAHGGYEPDDATGAVVLPLHLSTTFERAPDGTYPHGYLYARNDNPTRGQFESTLATLEGGAACAAFASGMAATTTLLQALRPGDHVLVADDAFYGVRHILRTVFEPWGLAWSEADLSDPGALEAA